MRKITLLFVALLLTTAGVWAQTVVTTLGTGKVYTLQCNSGGGHMGTRFIADNGTVINGQSDAGTFFILEDAGDGKYYIKSLISKKYINFTSESKVCAQDAPTTKWVTGQVSGKENTFYFKADGTTRYLNNNGSSSDGTCNNLQGMDHGASGPSSSNGCSLWSVREYSFQSMIDTYGGYTSRIGGYTEEYISAVKEIIDAVKDNTNPTVEEIIQLYNDLAAVEVSIKLPDTGKFYRIKNNAGNAYLTCGTTGQSQTAADVNGNGKDDIFYLTEDNKLVSYSNGLYFAAASGNTKLSYTSEVGPTSTTFAFSASPEVGKLYISFASDGTRYLYSAGIGDTNAGNDTSVDKSTLASNTGYRFTIDEVKYLPVTMSASVGYATLYSPVNLECGDAGNVRVRAYIATTVNSSSIKMVECTDGIPANTAVILKYEEGGRIDNGCVYLPVTSNKIAVPEAANQLEGSFAAENVSEDAYVLANKDGLVALYMIDKQGNTTWKNNGFKAYLPKVSESRFLLFDFGTETGIGNIEGTDDAATGKAVIYDLSGRRVSNAGKGIYIVNGKKVVK